MGCIGILLPIVGLIGFYNDIIWLFYVCGGIMLISDIIMIFNGQGGCWSTALTIAAWIYGYKYTGVFWDGIIWGTCVSSFLCVVIMFIIGVFTLGVGGAFAAFSGIKKLFNKE